MYLVIIERNSVKYGVLIYNGIHWVKAAAY